MGDYGDFYCTSRHCKDPNRPRLLEYELDSCRDGLDELDAIPCTEHPMYLEGNHEDNVRRYTAERCPELFNIVKVEEQLGLQKRGWEFVPYKDFARIGKLYVTHEAGFAGAQAHIKSQAAFGSNLAIGHTHRLASSYTSNILFEDHLATMVGWVGDRKKAEYMYKCNTRDWKLGCALAYVHKETGNCHVQLVPFINYTAVVEGKLLTQEPIAA